jgi:hypothetical protein
VLLMRNPRTKPQGAPTGTLTAAQEALLLEEIPANAPHPDSMRLRAIWDMEDGRPGSKISQKAMAAEWGVNASLITQYLNGHIPLNLEAKLRFARYLNKSPVGIWPDFEFADLCPGNLAPEALEIASLWGRLAEAQRQAVRQLILSLSGKPQT